MEASATAEGLMLSAAAHAYGGAFMSAMGRLAVVVLGATCVSLAMAAQPPERWPTRPLRVVVPFVAGGGVDTVARVSAAGLGAALGRAVPTVVVVGDGGALMSLGELETVARTGLPLTVVVLDDDAYAAELHHLRRHGLPEDLARFPHTDLAAVASALGLTGVRIETAADLERLRDVLDADGPVLVDVRVTDRVVSDRFRHLPRDNG